MFTLWRRLARRDLFETPFPEEYRTLLLKNTPLYGALKDQDRKKLESLVRILIAEKNFIGTGGLKLSEEMCVAIAARACLLILRRVELDGELYPGLGSIVVYPDAFRAKVVRREGYVVHEGEEVRAGESWDQGTVVLSWQAAKEGAKHPHDGHDVVLHEFAHQLDGQQGSMNGTPELPSDGSYSAWAKILSEEFHSLRKDLAEHNKTDIDAYGATNPAEFFAVLTEEFFEKPATLSKKHPSLYAELVAYYRLDPLELMREKSESD